MQPMREETIKSFKKMLTAMTKAHGNNTEITRAQAKEIWLKNRKNYPSLGYLTKNEDYRTTRGRVFITTSHDDVIKLKKAYMKEQEAILSKEEKTSAAALAKKLSSNTTKAKTTAKRKATKTAPKRKTVAKKVAAKKVKNINSIKKAS